MPPIDRALQPVLVTGLGILVLSCLDTAMKAVSAAYPLSQVVGLRYGAGTAVSLVIFVAVRERLPGWEALRRNLTRAVAVVLTAGCFFTALARLPLAQAIALTFLAPLFIALLGRLLLAEPIPPRIVLGVVLGFLGVVVIGAGEILAPTHALDPVGIAAAVTCAFFYALSNVLMRRQSGHDSTVTIVTLSNTMVFLLVSPVMAAQWETPKLDHLAIFALAGLLGTAGHLCLAWAYARASAGTLGIVEYTAFFWTSLLGFLFFAEVPSLATIIGTVIIVAACLVSFRRKVGA